MLISQATKQQARPPFVHCIDTFHLHCKHTLSFKTPRLPYSLSTHRPQTLIPRSRPHCFSGGFSNPHGTRSKNTDTSATMKKVLVMGLKLGSTDLSPEQVREVFKEQIDKAAAASIDMHIQQVDVTLAHDVVLDDIRGVLKKEQWDGVAIGFGLRGREDLTPLFERLVNTVVQEVQPTPKFCFPLRPHTVWESVSRVYGVKE